MCTQQAFPLHVSRPARSSGALPTHPHPSTVAPSSLSRLSLHQVHEPRFLHHRFFLHSRYACDWLCGRFPCGIRHTATRRQGPHWRPQGAPQPSDYPRCTAEREEIEHRYSPRHHRRGLESSAENTAGAVSRRFLPHAGGVRAETKGRSGTDGDEGKVATDVDEQADDSCR